MKLYKEMNCFWKLNNYTHVITFYRILKIIEFHNQWNWIKTIYLGNIKICYNPFI